METIESKDILASWPQAPEKEHATGPHRPHDIIAKTGAGYIALISTEDNVSDSFLVEFSVYQRTKSQYDFIDSGFKIDNDRLLIFTKETHEKEAYFSKPKRTIESINSISVPINESIKRLFEKPEDTITELYRYALMKKDKHGIHRYRSCVIIRSKILSSINSPWLNYIMLRAFLLGKYYSSEA